MTIKSMIVVSGIILALAAGASLYSLGNINRSRRVLEETQAKRERSLALAEEFVQSSRELTNQARKFAATGNEHFADAYRDIALVRAGEKPRPDDRAIAPGEQTSLYALMRDAHFTDAEMDSLLRARDLSEELIDLEERAMNLARGKNPARRGGSARQGVPDKAQALDLLFNEDYDAELDAIAHHVGVFKKQLDSRLDRETAEATAKHRRSLAMVALANVILILLFTMFLLMVWLLIVKPILRCDVFARQVARGKLDSRLSYTSNNEIGSLAKSLRSMLDSLLERLHLREQAEQAQREAAFAAESASRMKSSFLANMSHEIRTPMNGIIGFAEIALTDSGVKPKTRERLGKIKTSAESLLGILNDILDISKIEAGKIELESIPFTMRGVFTVCETISFPKAQEKGIILHFYAEPLLAKSLVGDPTRLRQVMLNLVSNAIKFTDNGIIKVKSIVQREEGDRVTLLFEVRDSGVGMTREQIDKIFEPFTQADSSVTRKYGGTGLGLSITKSIIELMGGELRVESVPQVGSRFSFELTFPTVDVPEDAAEREAESEQKTTKPRFSGDVLVCEDNGINQEVIVEHLSQVGLKATVAPNGFLGVNAAKTRLAEGREFDLIFMDIHMPVMDGLEATTQIQRLGVKAPIVALTANVMTHDRDAYLQHGMRDCLGKPFTTQELWSCLRRFLPELEPEPEAPEEADAALVAGERSNHIDRALGLEQTAGNVDLYKRLLEKFAAQNATSYQTLEDLVKAGDFAAARQAVHSLKGTAGAVGARKLSNAAATLEQSLASNANLSDIHKQLADVEVELMMALKEIAATNPAPTSF